MVLTRESAIAMLGSLIELLGGNATEAEETAPATGGKKGPGRPKKEAEPVPTPATPVAPAVNDPFGMAGTAVQAPPRVYTQQEMIKALQEVAAKRPGDATVQAGFDRVIAIIKKVNPAYENVSLVKAEDYAKVIAETGVVLP